MRLLGNLLFGVTPTDAVAFTAAPAVLLLTAAIACYLAARRATLFDPVTAMKAQ